jgi:non-ribosomal peptide synthetase-like protein
VLALLSFGAVQWLLGIFAYNQWQGVGPRIGWVALIAGWLLLASAPGRALLVVVARRLLLRRLAAGRYPRRGWLACRLWFVQRLAEVCRLDVLAGTPWAGRYVRACGDAVGANARLGTLPPVTGLVNIGAGATLEGQIDLNGWWIDGQDLVLGEIQIGAEARIGTRCLLMPGAEVGDGAEIEPGSVIAASVPAGERWSGSPARHVGSAGQDWPATPPPPAAVHRRSWAAMYGVGLAVLTVLPLVAAAPGVLLLIALGAQLGSPHSVVTVTLITAPLEMASFVITYALLVAVLVRCVSPLLRAGWHRDDGSVAWGLWFTESLMENARTLLFPLHASLYIRPWLRLAGISVGRRTEVSTAVGLNRLVSVGETSFITDDVVLASVRARRGWLHVAPIEVGSRTFLGPGAILRSGTVLGNDCLVGVLSSPPERSNDGTSWLGLPSLELPRIADRPDPARTTSPPHRLIAARGAVELVRILLPGSVSLILGTTVFLALEAIGNSSGGAWAMLLAAPEVLTVASVCAAALTVAAKWLIIGRYKSLERPLWSLFIWRDELINTCHEQLAGAWLLGLAIGTQIMPAYLRAMGAKVGRDVWFETMAVTEFDLVRLDDGCAINRGACIMTHLIHDRLMRTGPTHIGAGATLGPESAVLPDTALGAGTTVYGRSIVLRGEQLPPHSRWHGAPVESA